MTNFIKKLYNTLKAIITKNKLFKKKYRPYELFEQSPVKRYSPLINDHGFELNPRQVYDMISRKNRDFSSREKNAEIVADLINKKTKSLNILPSCNKVSPENYGNELIESGFVKIPNVLSQEQINDIKKYLNGKKIIDFYNTHKVFRLDNIPKETNIGRYTPEVNLNCPHIFEAMNNPVVLKTVEQFLGAKPTISVVMIMWSFANGNEAQQMQKFHRDNDDYRFCKLFILLNDVDDLDDGPHLYLKDTHSQEKVWQKIDRLKIPDTEKKELLEEVFIHQRHPDELIEKIFTKDQYAYHIGKSGTSIIENTWGIHRGLPPKRKHRLILQVQYSLTPTPLFNYEPISIKSARKKIKNNPELKYINRLYLR